jgi:toxin FitB
MFLLDANVIRELRRPRRAHPNVAAWADTTRQGQLFLSAITIWELEYGVLRMERRDAAQGAVLRNWMDHYVLPRPNIACDYGNCLTMRPVARARSPT